MTDDQGYTQQSGCPVPEKLLRTNGRFIIIHQNTIHTVGVGCHNGTGIDGRENPYGGGQLLQETYVLPGSRFAAEQDHLAMRPVGGGDHIQQFFAARIQNGGVIQHPADMQEIRHKLYTCPGRLRLLN